MLSGIDVSNRKRRKTKKSIIVAVAVVANVRSRRHGYERVA